LSNIVKIVSYNVLVSFANSVRISLKFINYLNKIHYMQAWQIQHSWCGSVETGHDC